MQAQRHAWALAAISATVLLRCGCCAELMLPVQRQVCLTWLAGSALGAIAALCLAVRAGLAPAQQLAGRRLVWSALAGTAINGAAAIVKCPAQVNAPCFSLLCPSSLT